MWIRSQDKKRLIECVIFELSIDTPTIYGYAKSGGFILGEYSTKGKALKVLDEIQNFINNLERYIIETDNYSGYHSLRKVVNNVVYQMPQDEDVKD